MQEDSSSSTAPVMIVWWIGAYGVGHKVEFKVHTPTPNLALSLNYFYSSLVCLDLYIPDSTAGSEIEKGFCSRKQCDMNQNAFFIVVPSLSF